MGPGDQRNKTRMPNTKILLVEDNPDDVAITLLALKDHNVKEKIFVVQNGQEALDFLFGANLYADREYLPLPRLVLLDLDLPTMDGLAVLRRIRAEERTHLLPVVLLSSSTSDQDKLDAYTSGANSFLCKPMSFRQYAQAIQQIVRYWLQTNVAPVN